ncbi:unnamed protein product [Clavelina lepadiformis]|uniref:Uncharacterized protein n=1 Tax=Clavelina lepadiformis TaxID=159417 RepID=A0ABP0FDY7_CLALP
MENAKTTTMPVVRCYNCSLKHQTTCGSHRKQNISSYVRCACIEDNSSPICPQDRSIAPRRQMEELTATNSVSHCAHLRVNTRKENQNSKSSHQLTKHCHFLQNPTTKLVNVPALFKIVVIFFAMLDFTVTSASPLMKRLSPQNNLQESPASLKASHFENSLKSSGLAAVLLQARIKMGKIDSRRKRSIHCSGGLQVVEGLSRYALKQATVGHENQRKRSARIHSAEEPSHRVYAKMHKRLFDMHCTLEQMPTAFGAQREEVLKSIEAMKTFFQEELNKANNNECSGIIINGNTATAEKEIINRLYEIRRELKSICKN